MEEMRSLLTKNKFLTGFFFLALIMVVIFIVVFIDRKRNALLYCPFREKKYCLTAKSRTWNDGTPVLSFKVPKGTDVFSGVDGMLFHGVFDYGDGKIAYQVEITTEEGEKIAYFFSGEAFSQTELVSAQKLIGRIDRTDVLKDGSSLNLRFIDKEGQAMKLTNKHLKFLK